MAKNIIDIKVTDNGEVTIAVDGDQMSVVHAMESVSGKLAQTHENIALAMILGICKTLPKNKVEKAVAKAYKCWDIANEAEKVLDKCDRSEKGLMDALDKILKMLGD